MGIIAFDYTCAAGNSPVAPTPASMTSPETSSTGIVSSASSVTAAIFMMLWKLI